MVLNKSLNRLGSIVKVLSPALLILSSSSPQLLAQSYGEWKVSLEFPPAEDRGQPTRSRGGGTRGIPCTELGAIPLTALMPTRNNIGTTVATNPTFFLYVPKTKATSARFAIADERGNKIYDRIFTLPNTPGIVKVNVPTTASLQVGKDYQWQFALICNPEEPSANTLVRGQVRPVELSSELKQKLEQTSSPLEQARLFAKERIWNETLSIAVQLRDTNPDEWQQLLKSVGLEDLASKPLIDCCNADN